MKGTKVLRVATVVVVALICTCIVSATRDARTLQEKRAQFEEWVVNFGKSYASPQEKEYRFQRFLDSLDRVALLNSQRSSDDDAFFGLTKFSDLTVEGLLQFLFCQCTLLHPTGLYSLIVKKKKKKNKNSEASI